MQLNLILVLSMAICTRGGINKCCPQGEGYDENLKCVPMGKTAMGKYWFPENSSEILLEMDTYFNSTPCILEQATQVLRENFEIFDNGSLSLLNDNRTHMATYSERAYCLEKLGGIYNMNVAYLCPCIEHMCVFKCCSFDQHVRKTKTDSGAVKTFCTNSDNKPDWSHKLLKGAKIEKYHEVLYSVHDCAARNQQSLSLVGEYKLLSNGSIDSESDGMLDPMEYCGEYFEDDEGARMSMVIACVDKTRISLESKIYAALTIIGAFFLLLTSIIHFWMPRISMCPGWSFPVHTTCLLVAYICLVYQQLSPSRFGRSFCIGCGFVMQFSFLASFFWLNVMCVDMSWTFSGIRPPSGSRKERERRKFIWYSLYAWGGASALTLAAIIVEFVPGVPEKSPYKPNFGVISCWFKENEALWLYFYGPMGILLLSNLGLFVYTSFRIILLKRGTGALRQAESAQHGSRRNKQRFVLYAKLFLLMGVTWLTEIISWIVGTEGSNALNYLWYITDAINLLRAVFIFIIFCWKPRVWSNIKKKFPCTKRCEEFFIRTCCRREPTPDAQEEQKTSSTNGGQKDTSENGVEMENK